MEILVIDSVGTIVGTVKDCTLFNLKNQKVCEVEQKTKFLEIIRILVSNARGERN